MRTGTSFLSAQATISLRLWTIRFPAVGLEGRAARLFISLSLLDLTLLKQMVDPQRSQFFRHRVLPQPRRQVREVHFIQRLILVEATEHHAFLPSIGVHVLLQTL